MIALANISALRLWICRSKHGLMFAMPLGGSTNKGQAVTIGAADALD